MSLVSKSNDTAEALINTNNTIAQGIFYQELPGVPNSCPSQLRVSVHRQESSGQVEIGNGMRQKEQGVALVGGLE
jgi:hypothetical protein